MSSRLLVFLMFSSALGLGMGCDGEVTSTEYSVDEGSFDGALKSMFDRQRIRYRLPGSTTEVSASLRGANGELTIPAEIRNAVGYECDYRMWRAAAGETAAIPVGLLNAGDDPVTTIGGNGVLFPWCENGGVPLMGSGNSNDPGFYHCIIVHATCLGNLYAELSEALEETTLVHSISGQTVNRLTIPAQDPETRAALLEYGIGRMTQTVQGRTAFTPAIFGPSCTGCDTPIQTTRGPVPIGQLLAQSLQAAYETMFELRPKIVDAYVAIAESSRSDGSDPVQAIRESTEIRAWAAQLAVGGRQWSTTNLLPLSPTQLPIPVEMGGSRSIDRAHGMIRESRLDPNLVVTGAPTDPGGPSTFATALRERIRVLRGLPSSSEPDARFFDTFGTTVADVEVARRQFSEQYSLFRRSSRARTAPIRPPAQWLSAETATVLAPITDVFAATAQAPDPNTPGIIFSALIGRSPGASWATELNVELTLVARFSDLPASPAEEIFSSALFAQNGFASRLRAVSPVHVYISGGTTASVFSEPLVGATSLQHGDVLAISESDPRVAADALRCAIDGDIDGFVEACASIDLTRYRGTLLDEATSAYSRRRDYVSVQRRTIATGPIYIVRRRSPSMSALPVPGSYEIVGGIIDQNQQTALVPEFEILAGQVLTPSTRGARAARLCSDVGIDEPLALENETTTNGDAVENSWRYYLSLARQAANEADMLGEAALNSEIELDTQADASLQALQQLCGVTLDTEWFRAKMTALSVTSVAELFKDARAIADPDVQFQRLRQCLSTAEGTGGTINQHVSLGKRPLCAWYQGGDPTRICQYGGNDRTNPLNENLRCPSFAAESVDDPSECPEPTPGGDYTPILIQGPQLLGYYESDVDPGATGDNMTTSCRNLREYYRNLSARSTQQSPPAITAEQQALIDWVKNSRFLNTDAARELAASVRWEALPDSGYALYANGSRLNLCPAVANAAECSSPTMASGEAGLLCQAFGSAQVPGSPSSPWCQSTGDMPYRSLRAAVAARWLGQSDLNGFMLPRGSDRDPGKTFDSSSVGGFSYRAFDVTDSKAYYCSTTSNRGFWRWNSTHPYYDNCGSSSTIFERSASEYFFPGSSRSISSLEREYNSRVARGVLAQFASARSDQVQGRYNEFKTADLYWIDNGSPDTWMFDLATRRGSALTFDLQALRDGVELLCEADRLQAGGAPACGDQTTTIASVSDFGSASRQIDCFINDARSSAAAIVFPNVPTSAMDALRTMSPVGATSQTGGEFLEQVTRLRSAFLQFARNANALVYHGDAFARTVRDTNLQLSSLSLTSQIARNQMLASVTNSAASCAEQSASTAGLEGALNPGRGIAVAIHCANMMAQIGFTVRSYRLQMEDNENQESRILLALETEAANRAQAIQDITLRIKMTSEEADAAIGRLESIRQQGTHSLRSALYLAGITTDSVATSQAVVRQRLNTANVRYRRALRYARQLAHLARRAIEHRFVINLDELDQDLQFVERPSSWANRVCTMSGLDYDRIASESETTSEQGYADEFIGDYVTKLEQLVLSYSFEYPFSEGQSTAVVSLRDDVNHFTEVCDLPAGNYVGNAANLGAVGAGGWTPRKCDDAFTETIEDDVINCVTPQRLAAAVDAIPNQPSARFGNPDAYRITFGGSDPECDTSTCSFTAASRLGQTVTLPAGRYVASWYGRLPASPNAAQIDAVEQGVQVFPAYEGANDWVPLPVVAPMSPVVAVGSGWNRYAFTFDVVRGGAYEVAIVNRQGASGATVDLGGLMIHAVEPASPPIAVPFVATTAPGVVTTQGCEDSDGSSFRSSAAWRYECESCASPLCVGSRRCYWETQFSVDDVALETGRIFSNSGFAVGNYNYRIQSLAINFVGSGSRTCTDPAQSSTCYAAGFIPYTLIHDGEISLRGYDQETHMADLYPSIIRGALGLATERYITNPISGNDQSALQQFTRREFSGRPLTGAYTLRVHDVPGVNFNGIEDVQVVLGYEYWTRSEL